MREAHVIGADQSEFDSFPDGTYRALFETTFEPMAAGREYTDRNGPTGRCSRRRSSQGGEATAPAQGSPR